MTSSPPEADAPDQEEVEAPHPLTDYATAVGEAVGGDWVITFDTIKVSVPADRWVEALTTARDQFDLVLFSFLSAVDWSNETAVGEPIEEPVDEEFLELLSMVSDVTDGRTVLFTTRLDHANPQVASLVDVYAGANWHEREAHEMFGIDFVGHPDLSHLYLPDGFLGNPLRKSFPLLSREVKPWPGKVDVEPMPEVEEEEEEAADTDGNQETAGAEEEA